MLFLANRYRTTLDILKTYSYPEPFNLHISKYFRADTRYGSKDRRELRELCYGFFRMGLLFSDLSIEQRLSLSIVLNHPLENAQAELLDLPAPLDKERIISIPLQDRINKLLNLLEPDKKHTHFREELEPGFQNLNETEALGFKPYVWFRAAKAHELPSSAEKSSLIQGAMFYREPVQLAQDIQIQDLSAQALCSRMNIPDGSLIWDCCAGAGGKTLNLIQNNATKWVLTDVRSGILNSAKARLKAFRNVNYMLADLLDMKTNLFEDESFDVIIADLPCSGSGTWFRDPEHFSLFNYKTLDSYVQRQRKIVRNIIPKLKSGGSLYFLTCSVFCCENSENVNFIKQLGGMELSETFAFNGFEYHSDSMYMAHFLKL